MSRLYSRLFRSHMTVAVVGLTMLLLAIASMITIRSVTLRTIQQRSPSVHNATLALEGTERSLAALRGWIALGDAEFKLERAAAWSNDIKPSIELLNQLSTEWQDEQDRTQLHAAKKKLKELRKTQWWIEDLARTPGNEPARTLHELQLIPIAEELQNSVRSLLPENTDSDTVVELDPVIVSISKFQLSLMQCRSQLLKIIDTGEEADVETFRESLTSTRQGLLAISENIEGAGGRKRNVLRTCAELLKVYEEVAGDVIVLRQSPRSNRAIYLLRNEAVPAAREASKQLRRLSQHQAELMRQDAQSVTTQGKIALGIAITVVFGLLLGTLFISRQSAEAFTQPIAILSHGAQQLAGGDLKKDLPVTTDDELGALTQAFNSMRGQLEHRAFELAESADALAQSNAELEQFAYVASHDLQEPLRKISSYCELLREEQGEQLDEEGLHYLNVAITGAERLRTLVRDLLAFSRISSRGKPHAPTNAEECLQGAIEQLELTIEECGGGGHVRFAADRYGR